MHAAVSRFWSRGLAHVRGSRLSTSVKKTTTELDAAVAAEVTSIAECKTSLKVSHSVSHSRKSVKIFLFPLRRKMQKSSFARYTKTTCYASLC